jgi:hypothetical protein
MKLRPWVGTARMAHYCSRAVACACGRLVAQCIRRPKRSHGHDGAASQGGGTGLETARCGVAWWWRRVATHRLRGGWRLWLSLQPWPRRRWPVGGGEEVSTAAEGSEDAAAWRGLPNGGDGDFGPELSERR